MRTTTTALTLVAAALGACGRSKADPTSVDATPQPAAAPLPPREDVEDPAETVAKLEAKVQRGDLAGFYKPEGYDLVTVKDGKAATERFPAALHAHGEHALAAWAAPEGSVFIAGYMYTGVPGPDTGAVYQKGATGPLRIGFTKTAKELSSVWGRTENDVYAGGRDLLVHWDGSSWKENSVRGIEGEIAGVWGNGSDLFVITNGATDGHVYARTKDGPWKRETTTRSCFLRALHGSGTRVWAGGDCGLVLGRNKDGSWKEERRQGGGTIFHLWATSEREVHAAATDLLYSRGDGAWLTVEVPSTRVFGITGNGRDVYALGVDGAFRGSGKSFHKLAFDATACLALAASGDTLHCLRERRVPVGSAPR